MELNVFGHAVCTLVTYCLWWHKPLDVQEPEPVVVATRSDAELIVAMSVFAKFGRRPSESTRLRSDNGQDFLFQFPIMCDVRSGRSWIVGYDGLPDWDNDSQDSRVSLWRR